jgi:ABC-type uncharacterized transport system permease subunit
MQLHSKKMHQSNQIQHQQAKIKVKWINKKAPDSNYSALYQSLWDQLYKIENLQGKEI